MSNKNGTTRRGVQSGTVLWKMLIEATFNQTNFSFIFSQSCDIKSEFSYIICSYLWRFVIQNSLKWDCYWSDSKSDRYFYLKLRSIYRSVYMLTDLCQRYTSAVKKIDWTTVVLLHCCTLIWGLTNNNYSLYLLQFMTVSVNIRSCYICIP